MNRLQKAVHEAIMQSGRGDTQSVRGVIPENGIHSESWSCTVQIPNPKGGKQPGTAEVLTFNDVPLPHNPDGVIAAIFNFVKKGPRAVTVGFKGGNLSFPYIINFESFLHQVTDKEDKKTEHRQSAIRQKFATAAAPVLSSGVTKGFIGPPNPATSSPAPSAGAEQRTAGKRVLAAEQTAGSLQQVLNQTTSVTVRA